MGEKNVLPFVDSLYLPFQSFFVILNVKKEEQIEYSQK